MPVRQRRQGCVLAMPALFCRAISFESIPESGVFRQITTAKTHSAGKVKRLSELLFIGLQVCHNYEKLKLGYNKRR